MARHVWSLLCRETVPASDGSLTILGVVNEYSLFPVPGDEQIGKGTLVLPVPLTVQSRWVRDDPQVAEVGKFLLTFVGPRGQRLAVYEYEIDLRMKADVCVGASVPKVPYFGLGRHELEVSLIKSNAPVDRVASIPFTLLPGTGPGPIVKSN